MGRAGSIGPDGAFDFGDQNATGLEDYQLEVPELEVDVRGKSAAPSELSRLSTPMQDGMAFDEGVETYADAACPIVMFDVKTQSQAVDNEVEPVENEGKGYSKNTVKALGIIRKELKPVDGEEDEDKVLSFRKMADKVRVQTVVRHLSQIFTSRLLGVLPRRFSSSCLFWVRVIVFN
jgi:cohesin complex subunit SCC1